MEIPLNSANATRIEIEEALGAQTNAANGAPEGNAATTANAPRDQRTGYIGPLCPF
jgi:hypothetical protein